MLDVGPGWVPVQEVLDARAQVSSAHAEAFQAERRSQRMEEGFAKLREQVLFMRLLFSTRCLLDTSALYCLFLSMTLLCCFLNRNALFIVLGICFVPLLWVSCTSGVL